MSSVPSSRWCSLIVGTAVCLGIVLAIEISATASDSIVSPSPSSTRSVDNLDPAKDADSPGTSLAVIPRTSPALTAAGRRSAFGGVNQPDYVTGFENPPFVTGFIGGQDGWTVPASGSTVEGQIATTSPATGLQHFRIDDDPALGNNSTLFVGGRSPEMVVEDNTPSVVSVDLLIGPTPVAGEYRIQPQSPSQGFLTARMTFEFDGDILVMDDLNNDGTISAAEALVDTGDNWTAGVYKNVRIEVNPGADTILYYYDNILIYSSVSGVFAANNVQHVVLLRNNRASSDRGNFDNLSIMNGVPVPGACCNGPDSAMCTIAGSAQDCAFTYLGNNTACSECPSSISCTDANTNGCFAVNATPGCETASCCQAVCALDAFCCVDMWDETCVALADAQPDSVCPPPYECNAAGGSPANDCCTTATSVTGDMTLAYNTTNALTDGPDDAANPCNSGPGGGQNDSQIWKDVWYRYTAQCNGQLTVSNCFAPGWDSKIAAYDAVDPDLADACDLLLPNIIACNEDGPNCPGFSSILTISVSAGSQYIIRLGGYSGTLEEATAEFGSGNITFDIQCVAPGANACAAAVPINNGSTVYTTLGATTDGPEHVDCNQFPADPESSPQVHNDIWFNHTATATGGLRIDTCGTVDYDSKVAVYNTCDCGQIGDGSLVACNDDGGNCPDQDPDVGEFAIGSDMIINVVQGQCYKIRVGGFGETFAGIGTITLTPTCTLAEPAGAVQEVELCNEDLNGGCNAAGLPEEFQNIATGDVVAGETWADAGAHDTDWFLIAQAGLVAADVDSDGLAKICYSVASEMPLGAGIAPIEDSLFPYCTTQFVYGLVLSENCTPSGVGDYGDNPADNPVETDGDYALLVLPFENLDGTTAVFDGYPCDNKLGNSYNACVQVVDDEAVCPTAEACLELAPPCPACVGDFAPVPNGNGTVNAADLAILLGAWGPGCNQSGGCCMDINGTGGVNAADLALLLGNWGPC